MIGLLFQARQQIKDRLYDKSGTANDKMGAYASPDTYRRLLREPDLHRNANMMEAMRGAFQLFAMRVQVDDHVPDGTANITLNGTHVATVDFRAEKISEVAATHELSASECAALDSFFGNRRGVTTARLQLRVAEQLPLRPAMPLPADPIPDTVIKTNVVDFRDLAAKGAVLLEKHDYGWNVTLTWAGRQAINHWKALA